jgi:hypothetical protein
VSCLRLRLNSILGYLEGILSAEAIEKKGNNLLYLKSKNGARSRSQ